MLRKTIGEGHSVDLSARRLYLPCCAALVAGANGVGDLRVDGACLLPTVAAQSVLGFGALSGGEGQRVLTLVGTEDCSRSRGENRISQVLPSR